MLAQLVSLHLKQNKLVNNYTAYFNWSLHHINNLNLYHFRQYATM